MAHPNILKGITVIATVGLAAVCACSAAPPSEPTGSSSEAVINGTPVTSDTLGSVELWHCLNGTNTCTYTAGIAYGFCSGTMVADRWLLTAHHCATLEGANTGGTAVNPNNMVVWSADRSTSATGLQIFLHPTLDVALIQLSSSITSGGHNYCTPVWTGSTATLVNQPVYCQGFGNNDAYNQTGYGTLRSAVMTVQPGTSPGEIQFKANGQGQILGRGDSGTGCFLNSPGSSSPNALVASHSTEDVSGLNFPPNDDNLVSADAFESWEMSIVKTANCAGGACGTITDACGQSVACGTCGSGSTCLNNVCCQPLTCAAAGATCGTLNDGCGGTVSCGDTCHSPYVCSVATHTCALPCTTPACICRQNGGIWTGTECS